MAISPAVKACIDKALVGKCQGKTGSSRSSCLSMYHAQARQSCGGEAVRDECNTVWVKEFQDFVCSKNLNKNALHNRYADAMCWPKTGTPGSQCRSYYYRELLKKWNRSATTARLQCRSDAGKKYKSEVCTKPIFNWRDQMLHVRGSDGSVRPGWVTESTDKHINCYQDEVLRDMATRTYYTDPNTPWGGVRGLGSLEVATIQGDKWQYGQTARYVPPWPEQKNAGKYIRVAKVRRTRIDGKDVLSVEAEGCKQKGLTQSGYFIVNNAGTKLPEVNSGRNSGMDLRDPAAYVIDAASDRNPCWFIGPPVPYAVALRDVAKKGVSSRYFGADAGWGNLDSKDLEIAQARAWNAALYFMEPDAELREKRKKLRQNIDRLEAAKKNLVMADTIGTALAKEQMQMFYTRRLAYPDEVPLRDALKILFEYKLKPCSEASKQALEKIRLEKEQVEIAQDIQAILDYRLKQLEEAGLILPPTEEASTQQQQQDAQAAAAPAWVKWGVVAAVGLVAYKFITK